MELIRTDRQARDFGDTETLTGPQSSYGMTDEARDERLAMLNAPPKTLEPWPPRRAFVPAHAASEINDEIPDDEWVDSTWRQVLQDLRGIAVALLCVGACLLLVFWRPF